MIPDWLLGGNATSESDTERNGFLSYSAEVHALGHGIADGAKDPKQLGPEEIPDIADVQEEPHYYKGGFVFGTLLQLLILALFSMASLKAF